MATSRSQKERTPNAQSVTEVTRGSECVCPGASVLINSLKDNLFKDDLFTLTEISKNPSAELFKKTYQRL